MGMLDAFKSLVPTENPEFGAKKKLIGDAVAQVQSLHKITSKKGAEWIVLKCEAIHPIADPKGRETTVAAGDELTKVYNPTEVDSLQDLANDLFTAGIDFSKEVETEDALLANMAEAAKGRLVYFRTWAKEKNAEQLEKNPNPSFFQNVNIKSRSLITPENSVPMLPF